MSDENIEFLKSPKKLGGPSKKCPRCGTWLRVQHQVGGGFWDPFIMKITYDLWCEDCGRRWEHKPVN
jgi:hypothetical protein